MKHSEKFYIAGGSLLSPFIDTGFDEGWCRPIYRAFSDSLALQQVEGKGS